jgi:hypothetical protein
VLYGSRERDAGLVKLKDLRAGAASKEHDVLVARVRQLVG